MALSSLSSIELLLVVHVSWLLLLSFLDFGGCRAGVDGKKQCAVVLVPVVAVAVTWWPQGIVGTVL